MVEHTETLKLPYRPDDVLDLVSDIRRYPEFIKWIKALRVTGERDEGAVQNCLGDAVISFKGFTERFSTHVTTDRSARTVAVRLDRGPFRKLRNDWRIEALDTGGSRLHFYIDYEFSNIVLQMLARANFELAINRIMTAFIEEAGRRYERVAPKPDG